MHFTESLDSEIPRIYKYIQLLYTKSQKLNILDFAESIWIMKLLSLDKIAKFCKRR